jgi:hypothetical protein
MMHLIEKGFQSYDGDYVMIGYVYVCLLCSFSFFPFLLRIHARYAWTISHSDSYAQRPLGYSINTCDLGCVFFSLLEYHTAFILWLELSLC